MLDIRYLRENFDAAEKTLATRGGGIDISAFKQLDQQRRELLGQAETLKAEKNTVSGLIGRTKDKSQVQDEIARMKEVSAQIKDLDDQLRAVEVQLNELLMGVPNLPHELSPVGRSEDDNVEIRTWGEKPQFDFEAKAHWDVGEGLGILDFERASKLSGARFALYFGAGARLERALINFMLDLHTEQHGYRETLPPFLVNRTSMTGTGQLPKFESDLFHTEDVDLFLIPTAEVR